MLHILNEYLIMMPDLLWDANQKCFPWSWMNSFIKEMNFWWAKIITHNKIIFDLQQCRPLTFLFQGLLDANIFFPWWIHSFIKKKNFWWQKSLLIITRYFLIYNNAFENKNSTQKYCVDCCRKKENYLAWVRTEELWHKILHLQ